MLLQEKMGFNQWFQKDSDQFKEEIRSYATRLRTAFRNDIDHKLKELKARSIIVSVQDLSLKVLQDFNVDRKILRGAKIFEPIFLFDEETKKKIASGRVVDLQPELVRIKLDSPLKLEDGKQMNFRIIFDERNIFKEIEIFEYALYKFSESSCSTLLQRYLLGYYSDWLNTRYEKVRVIEYPNLIKPKGLQILAIEQALRKRITLIEGVAGSGKSVVALNIACSMSSLRKRKVLLCSPIQSTVDRLADMLSKINEVSVVQLPNRTSFTKLCLEENSTSYNLKKLVEDEVYRRSWSRIQKSTRKPAVPVIKLHKQATRAVENSSSWLKSKIKHKLLSQADIVCCTLLQAGSKCLRDIKFDMLIIDDVHLAKETECLIAMMANGVKQVTLLSDMRLEMRLIRSSLSTKSIEGRRSSRLGSASSNGSIRRKRKAKRSQSLTNYKQRLHNKDKLFSSQGGLFERLLSLGLSSVALNIQYRMHETLAASPNHYFYMSRMKIDDATNKLITDQIHSELIKSEQSFNWLPNKRCLTAIFDSKNNNILTEVNEITRNLVERENVLQNEIGIITNIDTYTCDTCDGIEIGTIDNYYGKEKDFIILACFNRTELDETKTNEQASNSLDLNFLHNCKSLSIALTRAKLGLFIVTDLKDVPGNECKPSTSNYVDDKRENFSDIWSKLIKYYQTNNLVL